MSTDHTEIAVCNACLMTLANGESFGKIHDEAFARGIRHWESAGFHVVCGGGDGWFSWAPCELCTDRDGGNRSSAWVIPL